LSDNTCIDETNDVYGGRRSLVHFASTVSFIDIELSRRINTGRPSTRVTPTLAVFASRSGTFVHSRREILIMRRAPYNHTSVYGGNLPEARLHSAAPWHPVRRNQYPMRFGRAPAISTILTLCTGSHSSWRFHETPNRSDGCDLKDGVHYEDTSQSSMPSYFPR